MRKAVMYGAGNIGRGFIGQVFSESGYEVCFVDVDEKIIAEINRRREYSIKLVTNASCKDVVVKNVSAINGRDTDQVAEAIFNADIMATAVGVNILPKIVKPICAGLIKRFTADRPPLNIIICENLIDADKFLRNLIEREMGEEYKKTLNQNLGLVEASIGRMVPVMTEAMREGELLKVRVEPYARLPVDKDAFIGEIPSLKGLLPFSPFGFYIKRKLFIHNLGHAMSAYMGWLKDYRYMYECMEDTAIHASAKSAMRLTAEALNKEYGVPIKELDEHIADLLSRFDNKALGDTVERAGRDPLRKLGKNDRLTGAALYCLSQGINPEAVIKGIACGLKYDNPADESAVKLQRLIQEKGIRACIRQICGVEDSSLLSDAILAQYCQSN